jgi:nicotinamide-nucleotide amidase
MKIEVVCTGDELLTGLTVDTNSPYFMGKLFALGEKVARLTTVGDVREDITSVLREVAARADAVLVSGGLGPTADDFTAECAAEAAGVPLVEDPGVLAAIQARFRERNIVFTPNNARQARVPQGAEVVPNRFGSAPMFVLKLGACSLYFVPGVPREYKGLVDTEVLPRLKSLIDRQPGRVHRAFRLLKVVGLPESHLDARVAPLAKEHPLIVWGFRTQAPENHLKLMAEASSQAEADAALEAAYRACVPLLGAHLFGEETEQFPEVVGRLLESRGQTVALAESCTGGAVAQMLSAVPGASRYLLGGAVTYHERMKVRWAGVREETLAAHSAVSREVAGEMASGVRAQAGADWALSVTGYAGPTGGTEADPVGTVYLGLCGPDGQVEVERHRFHGDRERVRAFAAYGALDLLRRRLLADGGRKDAR